MQFLFGQFAMGPRLIVELDVEQLGDQVIRRVLLAPFDVLARTFHREVVVLFDRHRFAGFVAEDLVGVRAYRGLLGVGDAGEQPMVRIGSSAPRSWTKSN